VTVAVRLFAVLRERAGRERIELELPEHATVADALAALAELPDLDGVLARVPVQLAVNRDYASPETELHADDELALIPPLSGGRAAHVAVSERPLELESLSRAVGDPRAGAIVCFQGVTREVPKLQYEAYVEMARERIGRPLEDALPDFDNAAPRKWPPAGEHLVQHDAERKYVAPGVEGFAARLLGRHISERSEDGSR